MNTDRTIRIIHIEDLPSDSYLVKREIKRVLPSFDIKVVETRSELESLLADYQPDLILSDFSLPGFDWHTALSIVQEVAPGTPFIIVTGSTNEELEARCRAAGVTDFVTKLDIDHLRQAVLSALGLT